jgi:hypothetical protein
MPVASAAAHAGKIMPDTKINNMNSDKKGVLCKDFSVPSAVSYDLNLDLKFIFAYAPRFNQLMLGRIIQPYI